MLKNLLIFFSLSIALQVDASLETVPNLDLTRYMGLWHQIAAIPASFQEQCAANITATYSLDDDGEVNVLNSCQDKKGKLSVGEAKARINEDYNSPSKLEVTFANVFGKWLWIFAGNYWVIDLDDDYQVSVVSEPNREYLWILSRAPHMSANSLANLNATISEKGFNTCDIVVTQSGDYNNKHLCEFN